MAFANDLSSRSRGGPAIAALAVHGAMIAALIWGLAPRSDSGRSPEPFSAVITFERSIPTEPDPVASDDAGADPGAESLQIDAAPFEIPASAPLSQIVAPVAPEVSAGRDETAGSGSGGGGNGGEGSGAGSGGGIAVPARRIAGVLEDSDYPRAAEREGMEGTVIIAFRVRVDGAVDQCSVVSSSGHGLLDDLTCRLFSQRFRFEPARTAAGRAVESTLRTQFTWGTRRR